MMVILSCTMGTTYETESRLSKENSAKTKQMTGPANGSLARQKKKRILSPAQNITEEFSARARLEELCICSLIADLRVKGPAFYIRGWVDIIHLTVVDVNRMFDLSPRKRSSSSKV